MQVLTQKKLIATHDLRGRLVDFVDTQVGLKVARIAAAIWRVVQLLCRPGELLALLLRVFANEGVVVNLMWRFGDVNVSLHDLLAIQLEGISFDFAFGALFQAGRVVLAWWLLRILERVLSYQIAAAFDTVKRF